IPTFSDFVKKNTDFLVKNSRIGDRLQDKWCNLYHGACRVEGIKPNTTAKADWSEVYVEVWKNAEENDNFNDQQKQSNSESNQESTTSISLSKTIPSNSTNSSKSTSRHTLSETEQAYVNSLYQKLNDKKMWVLKSGRKVEKIMEECARDSKEEQGTHSMIIDPLDPVWESYFTEDELEEISSTNPPQLPSLTPQMTEYLKKFDNLTDLDELFDKANEDKFNPKKDADLYWLKQSIINALELYYCNFLNKEVKSASDLLHRIWRPVYLCFDQSPNISVTSGEKTCYASVRKRETEREVTIEAPRRFFGTRTDLLFYTQTTMREIGTTEVGLRSITESNKSINELELKVPKTMKDMLLRLIKLSSVNQNKIITCGLNISGLYLNQLVMNIPKGYVCRVSRFPVELQYPERSDNFIQLIKPILTTIYGTRIQMETTLKNIDIEREKTGILSYGFKKNSNNHNFPIPPCFTPIPTQRKRRI
ncbi:hypothetical protein INT45_008027, partial [Circinella minor]